MTPPPGRLPEDTRLVETPEQLQTFLEELKGEPMLAVDTEAASFHRYQDRIYLVQLSTRSRTAIVDPMAVSDLSALGALLADRDREIVFHDADYDLRLLDRQYGFRTNRIFDTRIAAQFLNEPGIGLAALLEKYLGVTADKKYQRADWSARPLKTEMLAYAAMDTRHLLEMRDILYQKLQEKGRLEWVNEEFEELESVRYTASESRADGEAWLKLKGARTLSPRSLAVLRELYRWREQTARRLDRAAFRIMNNEPILSMAAAPPRSPRELATVKGLSREIVERRAGEVLLAIERAMAIADDKLPKFPRPPRHKPDPVFEARFERLKAARNDLAREYDLQPGVLCPNGTLEAVARAAPASLAELRALPELRHWQANEFGERLVKVVAG